MNFVKSLIAKLRPTSSSEPSPNEHDQAYRWHTYEGPNGDRLRLFNNTPASVPLVLSVGGVEWRQIPPFGGEAPSQMPEVLEAGAYVYRFLTKAERTELVALKVRAFEKEVRRMGVQPIPRPKLQARFHREMSKQAAVFQVQEA